MYSAPWAAERRLLGAHARLSAFRALRLHQPQQVSELFSSPEVKGPEDSGVSKSLHSPLTMCLIHPTDSPLPNYLCPSVPVPARDVPAHGMQQTHTIHSGAPTPLH